VWGCVAGGTNGVGIGVGGGGTTVVESLQCLGMWV